MRKVVRTYLTMQRFEVFLAVLLPFFLIFESAMANGTVYAGGVMNIHDPRSWVAFGRGLFFEVLTYACAKQAKLLVVKKQGWGRTSMLIPGTVALWCIIVSAGNNLGWVLGGGDFVGVFASMARFMPHAFLALYEGGLGLLLPLAVGALALVDVSHLVQEAIDQSHFDNEALRVAESEMHRTAYLKGQEKQKDKLAEAYDSIAEQRANSYIQRVNSGDMSFNAGQKALPAGNAGIRRLNAPAAAVQPALQGQSPAAFQPLLQGQPPASSQPIIQGQVAPAGPSVGGTQPIVMPAPSSPAPQRSGILGHFIKP